MNVTSDYLGNLPVDLLDAIYFRLCKHSAVFSVPSHCCFLVNEQLLSQEFGLLELLAAVYNDLYWRFVSLEIS